MTLSFSLEELSEYTSTQLNNFFPDKNLVKLKEYKNILSLALDRLENCFNNVCHRSYNKDGEPFFNHLYSDHYIVYLWFLANTFWKNGSDASIASKLYYLNKSLHSFDCMYDTALPNIFLIIHGSGTMLGKAIYSDYFVALQGCTVGSHKGKYPQFGKAVALTAHSSVIGNCKVGDKVSVASYTSVFERDVPANSLVYTDRNSGKVLTKDSTFAYMKQLFNIEKI